MPQAKRSENAAPTTHAITARQPLQAVGNQSLLRFLGREGLVRRSCMCGGSCEECSKPIRAKLEVAAAGDELEREADAVADRVVRAEPAGVRSRESPSITRRSAEGVDAGAAVESHVASGSGAPIPAHDRAFFETHFDRDFSRVRVHTNTTAAAAAREINAKAFTSGADIAFAQGRYQPGTIEGRRLLAHELAHVVQSDSAPARTQGLVFRTPDPRLEPVLIALRAMAPTLRDVPVDVAVERLVAATTGIDMADQDNMVPIGRALSGSVPDAVLLGFLQQVDTRARPVRDPDDVIRMMQVRGHPYLGPGGVGLLPYPGAIAHGIASEVQRFAASSVAFLRGLVEGMRGGITDEQLFAFNERLRASSVLTTVFPIPFVAGAVVGIARDVVTAISGIIEIVGNFSEAIAQMAALIRELLDDPELARLMGYEAGRSFAGRLGQMSRENIVVFSYHLGELVGPTIFYTVCLLLGLPQIAGAIVLRRLASALREYPRMARILEWFAARLHPHAGVRPPIDPARLADWERGLSRETRGILDTPGVRERLSHVSDRTRGLLTLCESPCLPPAHDLLTADLQRLDRILQRLGVPDNHRGLREFFHRRRGSLNDAIAELEGVPRAQLDDFLDRSIIGSSRAPTGVTVFRGADGRWVWRRANNTEVFEYHLDGYGNHRRNYGTNSFFQSHHGVQGEWAIERGIPGYDYQQARGILLRDSRAGSPHQIVTSRQAGRASGRATRTYAQERALMRADLEAAGTPERFIQAAERANDEYFAQLYRAAQARGTTLDRLRSWFGTWTP